MDGVSLLLHYFALTLARYFEDHLSPHSRDKGSAGRVCYIKGPILWALYASNMESGEEEEEEPRQTQKVFKKSKDPTSKEFLAFSSCSFLLLRSQ